MPRLENWSIYFYDDNPYLAPELRTVSLRGAVYGHPNFEDGDNVLTSPITSIEGRTVRTENTEYTLGDVNPTYLKWYKENGPGKCDLESDSPLTPRED